MLVGIWPEVTLQIWINMEGFFFFPFALAKPEHKVQLYTNTNSSSEWCYEKFRDAVASVTNGVNSLFQITNCSFLFCHWAKEERMCILLLSQYRQLYFIRRVQICRVFLSFFFSFQMPFVACKTGWKNEKNNIICIWMVQNIHREPQN